MADLMSHVVVIGAGLSGLSAACHLIADGHRVTVVERERVPGGRNGILERDGFTFDTGPTVLTMLGLLEGLFTRIGSTLGDHLSLQRLDPAYLGVFADGSTLRVRAGHEAMRDEIARECSAGDAAAFDGFVSWLRRLYDVELGFIDRNYSSPLDLLSDPVAAARLLRLGAFGRLGPTIDTWFADERLRRLFSFQAMYAGLAPADALALYAVITYMDSIEGVWFPAGGMHAVPRALAEAAAAAGAEFRYGATVTDLIPGTSAVAGVSLVDEDGATHVIDADAVVCTIDLPVAYATLLPKVTPPAVVRRAQYSPSCLVWHVGVKGDLPDAAVHHTIHFGGAWASSFDELITQGRIMSDPSRFVCTPSLSDPTLAPAGHHTLYVLEPVPNLKVGPLDWDAERGPARQRLLDFLTSRGYPTEIVTEELVTPADWERTGLAAGTPFALAHSFSQTGPFRPANTNRRVPGLVFAGSGTVPGVGVPMVVISGGLAAQRVKEYLG